MEKQNADKTSPEKVSLKQQNHDKNLLERITPQQEQNKNCLFIVLSIFLLFLSGIICIYTYKNRLHFTRYCVYNYFFLPTKKQKS